MIYLMAFTIAVILAMIFTVLIKKIALGLKIVDIPDGQKKLHDRPMPLLGGVAIFLAVFLVYLIFNKYLLAGNLGWQHFMGVFIGALILMIGGVLDDKYNLSPKLQIIFPILAALAVIIGGVEIAKITNPFGGYFELSAVVSGILITLWLLGMMYTTKLLDGVDGLVSGLTSIAAIIIFLFTLTTRYYQPDIALAAVVLAGAGLGFLRFNFYPAKIFLGEGGSLFLGFMLGILSIISGSKIAVALLVMGIPILDVVWTIIRRLKQHQNPFRFADRKHLHHRLLDSGLGPVKTVLVFYGLALIFGLSALFLQSSGKFLTLLLLIIVMVALVIILSRAKSKLLLHICCAPCGAYTIKEILAKKYQVTLFFFNPNIDTLEEFQKRLLAVKDFATKFGFKLIVIDHERSQFLEQIKGLETMPEGGKRCELCINLRLRETAVFAASNAYDLFGTTLTASSYKNSETIMALGKSIASNLNISFLDLDFKDHDGVQKSINFAKQQGYYRQKYCGCRKPDFLVK